MNEITKELLDALQDCERVMSAELKGLLVIQPELEKARTAIAKAEAILAAPQPSDNEWIPWMGGKCPVPTGTIVDVMYRNGSIGASLPANESLSGLGDDAGPAYWRAHGASNDIIAYRVVKP